MISTINPNTALAENLVRCRCEIKGKYYIFDTVGNMLEVTKKTYDSLTCEIRNPKHRRLV